MHKQLVKLISIKNPIHGKYLESNTQGLTPAESASLDNLIQFYIYRGDDIDSIADKYLKLINVLTESQLYFFTHGRYQYSTFEEVSYLYNESSYMESYVVGLGLSTYLWHTHRDISRFFMHHICKIPHTKKYLEIGPGHGEYFVNVMRSTNMEEYTAIDISQTSVDITNDFIKYSFQESGKNCNVFCQDFFTFESTQKYDILVMGEILEHVENPLAFLNKSKDLTHENSIIYVSTAINAPQPDHIYHFRHMDDLFKLFSKAGLEVVDYITSVSNNVPMEKAIKKKVAITVAFILKQNRDKHA